MKFWKRTRRAFSMICCLALILAMVPAVGAASGDFTIKNGVLTKYNGAGGAVTIPEGVTEIGDLAFSECAGLTSITIPDSVTKMGQLVFQQCTGLTSITLPNGLTTITAMTFNGCSNLASVTIPASVTNIEFEAFYDCGNLRDVYYAGTQAQWKAIDLDDYGNEDLLSATIHYNTVPEQPDKPSTTPDMPSGVDQTLRGPGYAIPTSGNYTNGQFGLGSGLDHSVKLLTISNCRPRQDFSTINVYDQSDAKIKTVGSYFANAAYGCLVDEVKAGFYPNPSDSTDLILCKATFPRQYAVDITVSGQTITLTEGDSLNGPVKGYNTLALKCEHSDGHSSYYSYYFFYLERQDETPEFAQTQPTIPTQPERPTQPEQPTTPNQPEQPEPGPAAGKETSVLVKSNNRHGQNYLGYAAKTVTSYLYANETGGLTRVEYTGGKVIIENYDSNFNYLSGRIIEPELPVWGGFFAGVNYNFLIFGQNNSQESNSTEVIRVVKYSRDWQRLGQASLYGANTETPFRAGSLRCDECNGYLYIRTSHRMYKSSDGLNHQANLTMAIHQSDMSIVDDFHSVMNLSVGYVSHSFNQFILVDQEGRLIALDHGDAYPRAAVLVRYNQSASAGKVSGPCTSVTVQAFPGAVGQNSTGATLGGLAETTSGYVVAYNYDSAGSDDNRQEYLAYIGKNSQSSTNTRLSVEPGSTPVLAPTGLNGGYILWGENNSDDRIHYVSYSANGSTGSSKSATGALSSCQPIYYNGKVVWYVTNDSAPVFYTLDNSGVTAVPVEDGASSESPTTPETPTTPTNPTTPTKPTDPTAPAQTKTANPTNDKLTVNGVLQNPTVYKIGGSNYFQIRDVAAVLNGTEKQFSVGYSGGKVTATSGQPYETTGKELKGAPSSSKTATHSNDTILINGQEASLTVYKIGGSNYFKLRDLGKALNFYVGWIAGKGVYIETDKPYSE